MDTLTRSASIRNRVRVWRDSGRQIALVSTSGALHKGHMSLIAEAQERAHRVVVSIFAHAPLRTGQLLEADRELLSKLGPDVLFVPPIQEVFPIGVTQSAEVSVPELGAILEGTHDPRRFVVATTVMYKLFNIVRPDVLVVGERDFQQLVIMRRLIDDLFLSIDVVACPVFRDGDGLAVASSNRDLSPDERRVAPQLQAVLADVGVKIDAGERDFQLLEQNAKEALDAAGFITEYLSIRQATDLGVVRAGCRDLVVLAAAQLGRVRLTDNRRIWLIDRF